MPNPAVADGQRVGRFAHRFNRAAPLRAIDLLFFFPLGLLDGFLNPFLTGFRFGRVVDAPDGVVLLAGRKRLEVF